jgi:DNA-binding LacI/PurR family transcriptional regulator
VVFLDRSVGDGHDDIVVKLDNRRGVRVAIEYLAGLGHRRIGTIGVPVTITPGAERLEGYRAAVHAHGLDADPSLVRYADFTVESAFRETKALLSLPRRPTALLPLSGPTTVGALKAIMEAHLTVPRDLSVIGFDEFEYAELLSPPLTTIAQPAYEFGTVGVELLVRLLQGKRIRQRTVVLEPTLIERLSCAPTSGDRT